MSGPARRRRRWPRSRARAAVRADPAGSVAGRGSAIQHSAPAIESAASAISSRVASITAVSSACRQAPLESVALGIVQRGQQQRVVHRRRRVRLDVPLDEVRGFALIARQQPLIVVVLGRQRGRVGHQRADELQPGTCLPSTTRHTVSGVASSRPSGPQSQVQNATDTSSATCDTPAAPA